MEGSAQLLRRTHDLWPSHDADAIVAGHSGGYLRDVCASRLQAITQGMRILPEAAGYIRNRTGICVPLARFVFTKPYASKLYPQTVP